MSSNLFAKIESGSVYYYHNDHLGTPQKMTDSSGSTVWYGEFLPFGEPLSISGTIINNLRFPGQYYDEETGLHYNYFRDYAPMIGRYVEADPIGIDAGKNHLYSYTGNSPLTTTDPDGTLAIVMPGMYYCGLGAKRSLEIPSDDCVDEACRKHDICYRDSQIKIYPPYPPFSKKRRDCDRTLCEDILRCKDKTCIKLGIATVFNCFLLGK